MGGKQGWEEGTLARDWGSVERGKGCGEGESGLNPEVKKRRRGEEGRHL